MYFCIRKLRLQRTVFFLSVDSENRTVFQWKLYKSIDNKNATNEGKVSVDGSISRESTLTESFFSGKTIYVSNVQCIQMRCYECQCKEQWKTENCCCGSLFSFKMGSPFRMWAWDDVYRILKTIHALSFGAKVCYWIVYHGLLNLFNQIRT